MNATATNPIRTATIPVTTGPAMLLVQHAPGTPISYASIHCDSAQAIDMLRRALIHLVAEQAGLTNVPTHTAITTNGRALEPAPDGSRVLVAAQPFDAPPLARAEGQTDQHPAPARQARPRRAA